MKFCAYLKSKSLENYSACFVLLSIIPSNKHMSYCFG